jgi:hypothetical protein
MHKVATLVITPHIAYLCAIMAKYRRLTLEELELLKKDFIRFLAAQSITGEDWENIQKRDPEKQNQLVDHFSDVVLEKTLHNVKFLEHRSPRRILFFQFLEDKAQLFGIEFEKHPSFPLDESFEIKQLIDLLEDNKVNYSLLQGERDYEKDRKMEIYQIIQQGAQISPNEELFNFVLKFVENN